MSKPTYRTSEDEISFNIINKDVVEKLERDGDIKLPKKKLDIPKDKRWNTKQMQAKLLQGITNGDSIPTISKSLVAIIGNNKASQIRNARTMTTGAENAGRLDSYKNLEEQGVVQKKVWIATPDDRTRASHIDIDGEEVDIDAEFSNGCKCPGDPDCPDTSEVWNCRCSMRSKIVGFRRPDGSISRVDYTRGKTLHDTQMEAEKANRKTTGAEYKNPVIFEDEEMAKKWFRNTQNSNEPYWRLDYITDEETEAIKDYTEDSAKFINKTLYAGENIAKADIIESAIDKFELKDTIQVTRHTDFEIFGNTDSMSISDIQQYLSENGNDVFIPAFLSTSADQEGVGQYGKGLRMNIIVPPNTGYGAYVSNISNLSSENEYLINRRTTLQFDPDSLQEKDGIIYITARLLGRKKV